MKKWGILYLSFLLFLTSLFTEKVVAQQAVEAQEVHLTFRFQNIFHIYVTAYYVDGEFLLPHTELFRALQIDANVDLAEGKVTGQYLDIGLYSINYQTGQASVRDRQIVMPAEKYMVRELDYYLHPSVYQDLFGLEFEVDFSTLSLRLLTEKTMPVTAQRDRERRRDRELRTRPSFEREFYPLRFDRNQQVFDGGFLDYTVSANFTQELNTFLFNTAVGTELLGGDFQGRIFGNWSQESYTVRSSNLRWQYGIRDNPWVTRVTAGQTTSRGLRQAAYTGIQITNEPIEPRYLFDDFVFSGTTTPNSEVELYRNHSLVDFTQVDESGNYRFQMPLTYGTSQYTMRIYGPSGDFSERLTRIQIPFTFVPPGEVNYTIDAGRLDNPIAGSPELGYLGNANVTAGINNWLSTFGGVEYFEHFHEGLPTFNVGVTSRLFTKYLLTAEATNDAFFRLNSSVLYGSGASLSLDYTHFLAEGGLYNPGRIDSRFGTTVFTPFEIKDLPFFFRWSVRHEQRPTSDITRYRFDLNSRLNRLHLRLGYRDTQTGTLQFTSTPTSRISASARYNFSRGSNVPDWLKQTFIRGQLNYSPGLSQVEDLELQVSRSLFTHGRFQAGGGRNFIGNFTFFRLNVSFNFDRFRTNTTARSSRGRESLTQNINGSVGFDSNNNKFSSSNRQQVGRAGAAVRLFIDHNNSGTYDEGDELLDETAIRIERAGGFIRNVDGVNYITQLQPYRRYNLVVNKSAIRNPLLVPSVERFSFVTDPNQYKSIDIPLYMSGVIEGKVQRRRGDVTRELAGVRLLLTQIDLEEGTEPYTETIRTFSDGSFYAYEIPPGRYKIEVDPNQLEFLGATTIPETLEFEVRSLAEGDFVENLQILVVPRDEFGDEEIGNEMQ